MSARRLRQASVHVTEGWSLVIPLIIDGLPESVEALGRRWMRKREFHLTVLASRLLEAPGGPSDEWDQVIRVASGRGLGPVSAGEDLRRVADPERPGLETLIVMAECGRLRELIGELSEAVARRLPVPPAHVTLYSTDPAQGIGITDETELAERAPPLSEVDGAEVRRAIGW